MKKKPLTVAMMARKGGLCRSDRKAEAARNNGLRGGRPVVKVNGAVVKEVLTTKDPDDEPI